MSVVKGEKGAVIIIYFLMEAYNPRMQIGDTGVCKWRELGREDFFKLQKTEITTPFDKCAVSVLFCFSSVLYLKSRYLRCLFS